MISARELTIIWANGDTPWYWCWIDDFPGARYISLSNSCLYYCFWIFFPTCYSNIDCLRITKRFPEVAKLRFVWWFEIGGKIDTSLLSTMTTYVAFLVFKPTNNFFGFDNNPVEVTVGLDGGNVQNRTVYFDRRQQNIVPGDNPGLFPKERRDGWLESELGEFFTGSDEEGKLSMTILEINCSNGKHGLVVQGIEIRPKKRVNK
ncbi:hypothetical protein Dsin_019606 [Dipteronia sinensis]|uniref:Uncharacterized protein n=1 Tax=Dipteronia sinensis TaxID=43782 RepID=A0AAE0A7L3_9ROSI|nr:hypothetical protein Dsin_019606 [Dipteronia sinensis]